MACNRCNGYLTYKDLPHTDYSLCGECQLEIDQEKERTIRDLRIDQNGIADINASETTKSL